MSLKDKLTHISVSFGNQMSSFTKRLAYKQKHLSELYSKAILSESFYKKARYLTFPWHWIIIVAWILTRHETKSIPFDEPGVQIISGGPGAGKTSCAYEIIERDRILNGKPWYINTPFEKVRSDYEANLKFRYHALYDFSDFWSDRKTHKIPNHILYGGMVIDEIHRILNPRYNNTNEYNDKFEPFSDYAVVVRHFIKKIIATTQMNRVDIQFEQLAKYFHRVRIDIGFDYEDWLVDTGLFRFKPLGWYVETYTVDASGRDSIKVPYKTWYFPQQYANMDYYNTYSMSQAYSHVKMDRVQKKGA
jgi:hypothetical protein